MFEKMHLTYGFEARCLSAGELRQRFPCNQGDDNQKWVARALESRAFQHQADTFQLYHLPQVELYVLVIQLDGTWVRTFEEPPSLAQVAQLLRSALTGLTAASQTPYIPSGTLEDGWKELEREVRLWWWGRLLDNINRPRAEEDLTCWPQRWADLWLELAPPRPTGT